MNIIKGIEDVYLSENNGNLNSASWTSKVICAYMFYHYYNADTTVLTEISDSILFLLENDSFVVKSIIPSNTFDDGIDFLFAIDEKSYKSLSIEELCAKFREISRLVGGMIYQESSIVSSQEIQAFNNLEFKVTDSTTITIRAICCFEVNINEAIEVQQKIASIEVKSKNVIFDIIFQDNLEEEISDIESPKEYVVSGAINLFTQSICTFGKEESFVTLISAKSLKQLFFQYATRGLFASNLRFYITSKKIDGKIVESIKNEPENFCYFNNGIIITCDDYSINNNTIFFKNFSIVNGGQTTNLIGRTPFDDDFGVVCKVIKNKYESLNERIFFLSKVAEASNTQKPINARDLIANKIEQRKLKIQFAEVGIFLKIKRGEKIVKQLYPKPYMNASNDEITQMLYSYVYQTPGTSKNSKSSLISNERIYNLIFKNKYDSNFFVSIQHLKVAFSEWQKSVKKNELHTSNVYGLSKHANYTMYALIGFILKVITNRQSGMKILFLEEISWKSDELKSLLRCNDIGTFSIIDPMKFDSITKNSFFDIFDYLTDNILVPAYNKFKDKNQTYAYAQFCKTDSYYYDYILPYARNILLKKQAEITTLFQRWFNIDSFVDVLPGGEDIEMILLGLEDELKTYKLKIQKLYLNDDNFNDSIRVRQIPLIMRYFPKTSFDLITKCDFTEEQVEKYGSDILKIVNKYIKTGDFE